ncbi:DAK2 domain-containing protein [Aquipuribacter hungaricus]|uniref:DAK2 domain-containing protein n=2 Tax=Aquipuribacter hungaricus TaxID=545624 RepID=A0ABV7WH97_9MICO
MTGPEDDVVLDGAGLRAWARLVASRLDGARADIDALNVFPVPDGDTGTNLALTVGGAVTEPGGDLARALLVHARGNSGVIASQLVRGWADVLTAPVRGAGVGPELLAKALRRGDDLAWAAVADPQEGTVLTVSRAAAEAAERAASAGSGLLGTVDALVAAAEEALARTPAQLPALAAAGVVDAGGAGLVLALVALRDVVHGTAGAVEPGDPGATGTPAGAPGPGAVPGADLQPGGPGYEVMYLLAADDEGAVDTLRAALLALGDSVLVVGGGDLWHVHVHTDDPGAAVEAGLAAGRPSAVRITHFAAARAAQHERIADAALPRDQAHGHGPGLAVVACAAGAATEELCRAGGATVVPSAPGARASTGDLLAAVVAAGEGGRRVLLLPNDAETAAVAHQAALAAEEQGVTAVVARSRSQVQVLGALAVLGGGLVDDVVGALRSAAAAVEGCRHGAVAVAARAASTPAGPCRPGDAVGTVGRDVVAVGTDPVEVAVQVVEHLGGDVELVTVLPGLDGAPVAAALAARLRADGRVTVDVCGGGQPRYLLLLGCE